MKTKVTLVFSKKGFERVYKHTAKTKEPSINRGEVDA